MLHVASLMPIAALIVALLGLALAMVAYWRSGGAQDVQKLKTSMDSELEHIHTKQKELVESAVESLAAAYERSRLRLAAVRENLRKQKDEAIESVETQVELAREQLEELAQQLEQSVETAEQRTVAAARQAEQAIASRVRRLQARATLIHAKSKAARAQRAAAVRDFERADHLLAEATEHLFDARELLHDDRAQDLHLEQQLDAVRYSLREATAAVRTRAENVQKRLDKLLADSDRIVSTLESKQLEVSEHAAAA